MISRKFIFSRAKIPQSTLEVSGMTLLEVMVALVIFAMTGTAVMKAASDHLNGVGQIEQITFATWVANNRLTQLSIDPSWPPKDNQKGSEEMAYRTWYWHQKVIKTNDKDMFSIEVSVSLNEQQTSSITTVNGFVAKATAKP
ncbi:MAG: general secretion pathway protein I [Paraglaciecola sp.]|jgi:general secretion pathway protein I